MKDIELKKDTSKYSLFAAEAKRRMNEKFLLSLSDSERELFVTLRSKALAKMPSSYLPCITNEMLIAKLFGLMLSDNFSLLKLATIVDKDYYANLTDIGRQAYLFKLSKAYSLIKNIYSECRNKNLCLN